MCDIDLLPKHYNGELKVELDGINATFHLLGYSDTFLDDIIPNSALQIPVYVMHRKGRIHKSGGGLVASVADY